MLLRIGSASQLRNTSIIRCNAIHLTIKESLKVCVYFATIVWQSNGIALRVGEYLGAVQCA